MPNVRNPATTYLIVARDGARVSYWNGTWWESDPAGAATYNTPDAADDALIDAEATGAPEPFDPESVEIRVRRADGAA